NVIPDANGSVHLLITRIRKNVEFLLYQFRESLVTARFREVNTRQVIENRRYIGAVEFRDQAQQLIVRSLIRSAEREFDLFLHIPLTVAQRLSGQGDNDEAGSLQVSSNLDVPLRGWRNVPFIYPRTEARCL